MFIYTSACAKCGEVKTRNKKKKTEPPFEERERERERVCDDFSKRRKVSTEIGLTLPSRW